MVGDTETHIMEIVSLSAGESPDIRSRLSLGVSWHVRDTYLLCRLIARIFYSRLMLECFQRLSGLT